MRSIESYIETTDTIERSCVVHLENPETGKEIDLIGLVHIGTQRFYDAVKQKSEACDAVIYEQVKRPRDDQAEKPEKNKLSDLYVRVAENVSSIRNRILRKSKPYLREQHEDDNQVEEIINELSDRFKLVFQGDAIDYDNAPENWHNADLKIDEFLKNCSFRERLLLKMIGFKWVRKLLSSLVATSINSEGLLSRLSRKKLPKREVDRLREEKVYEAVSDLTEDASVKKIAIQYGLAHLPFLEEGLAQMGYSRTRVDYIDFDDWQGFSPNTNNETRRAA